MLFSVENRWVCRAIRYNPSNESKRFRVCCRARPAYAAGGFRVCTRKALSLKI